MKRWFLAAVWGLSLLAVSCRQPMQKVFAERLPNRTEAAGEAGGIAAGGCGPKLEGRHPRWDLNRVSERRLAQLPGMTPVLARQLVAGRPYREKRALLSRRLLTPDQYRRWKDYLVVHRLH